MTTHDDAIEAAGRYVLLHSPMSWLDARSFGAAIVDEVEPLIRAQIAAEIEATDQVEHESVSWMDGWDDGMECAARIARGES